MFEGSGYFKFGTEVVNFFISCRLFADMKIERFLNTDCLLAANYSI
jgi:hypothetical protein